MEENLMANNEPVVIDENIAEELDLNTVSSGDAIVIPDNLLTNEVYTSGVNDLVNAIDPLSVNEDIIYVDYGTNYSLGTDLPDYAVTYDCNGVEVVFPTDYAEEIIIVDGLLINLGNSYTAGLQIDGYNVDNYLSSELTIPTYHSATWYQYLQSYGQPYRIVDRYVNNYGSISSSTRSSVNVEWSGGNAWEGFTFDRAALFIIISILAIMLIFRKGR